MNQYGLPDVIEECRFIAISSSWIIEDNRLCLVHYDLREKQIMDLLPVNVYCNILVNVIHRILPTLISAFITGVNNLPRGTSDYPAYVLER